MVMDSCQHPLFLKSVWLLQKLEADYKAVTDKEKEEVVALGGLHVVGTERHVSGFVFNHPALLRRLSRHERVCQWDRGLAYYRG